MMIKAILLLQCCLILVLVKAQKIQYSSLNYDFRPLEIMTQKFMNNHTFPSSSVSVYNNTQKIYKNFFGNLTYPGDNFSVATGENTIYDMASLTKVIATTSGVMRLFEQKKLKLSDKLVDFIPEAKNNGKDKILIENLLLHNAGLLPDYPVMPHIDVNRAQFLAWLYNSTLDYPIGTKMVYSDLSYVFLQQVVERITKKPLNIFLKEEIFDKMNLKRTMFVPALIYQAENQCAPTEDDFLWRAQLMRCVVQDPTAYVFGGICGNAGLFSTLEETTTFMTMMLNKGLHKNGNQTVRVFEETTVDLFTKRVTGLPYDNTRALGWDTNPNKYPNACGQRFSNNSFGHTGYTGTMVWIDKDKNLGVVVLTNRVYPEGYSTKTAADIMWYRNNAVNSIVDALKLNETNIIIQ